MTEFKVGDRVKVVSTSATHSSHYYMSRMHPVGAEFTVAGVGKDHGSPFVKDDDGFYWHPNDLELADVEPEPCACIGRPRRDARGRLCDRRCPDLGSMDRGEPEPLKEGDEVLMWVRTAAPGAPSDDVNVWAYSNRQPVTLVTVRADAIVRPAEGQVPPWEKEPVRPEEPTADYAIARDGFRTYVRLPADQIPGFATGKPWALIGVADAYFAWDEIKEPKVVEVESSE